MRKLGTVVLAAVAVMLSLIVQAASPAGAADSDILFYDANGDSVSTFYAGEPFGVAFPNPEPCPLVSPLVGGLPSPPVSAYSSAGLFPGHGISGLPSASSLVDQSVGSGEWSVPVPSPMPQLTGDPHAASTATFTWGCHSPTASGQAAGVPQATVLGTRTIQVLPHTVSLPASAAVGDVITVTADTPCLPGSEAQVRLSAHADGFSSAEGTSTVPANGLWSVDVAVPDPSPGTSTVNVNSTCTRGTPGFLSYYASIYDPAELAITGGEDGACPAAAQASLGSGSLLGAEALVSVVPVGAYLWWRRRRNLRSAGVAGTRLRSVLTRLMIAGVGIAAVAACAPIKPPVPPC